MNIRLTIRMEQTVLKKAEKCAKDQNICLSDLVENYLKALKTEVTQTQIGLTPIVKSLKGSFNTPKNFDNKKDLTKSLSEKYL